MPSHAKCITFDRLHTPCSAYNCIPRHNERSSLGARWWHNHFLLHVMLRDHLRNPWAAGSARQDKKTQKHQGAIAQKWCKSQRLQGRLAKKSAALACVASTWAKRSSCMCEKGEQGPQTPIAKHPRIAFFTDSAIPSPHLQIPSWEP